MVIVETILNVQGNFFQNRDVSFMKEKGLPIAEY